MGRELSEAWRSVRDSENHLVDLVIAASAFMSLREIADAAGFDTHRKVQQILGRHRNPRSDVVYFVQRNDGAIKIGTTKRALDERVHELELEHGDLRVLATQPGDYRVERELHERFEDVRLGPAHGAGSVEWFMPTVALLDHISTLG